MAAGRVILVGGLALLLAALLNAETLEEMAERQPFGWRRDAFLAVTTPLHTVSRLLYLDRPGEAFDSLRGRDNERLDLAELTEQNQETVVPDQAAAPAPTTTTTLPPLRRPTPAQPLALWVGGDSMSQVFGQSLVRLATESGIITATLDSRVSTGLTRPDFFDWSGRIVQVVEEQRPEVVVAMFGANDAQAMQIGGRSVDVEHPEWQAEYRRRVGLFMDYLTQQGVRVWWVGQPIMESSGFTERMRILNAIYAEEAATRQGVTFVDTFPMFSDANGAYAAYLPAGSGEPRLMRQQDGIHLTRDGGDRMARAVLDSIIAEMAPVTTPTTPPPTTPPTPPTAPT